MSEQKCNGCPFNEGITEEAEQIQNYGCLPDGRMILQAKDQHDRSWLCHSNESRICAGLQERRDTATGERVSPTRWCRGEQNLTETT